MNRLPILRKVVFCSISFLFASALHSFAQTITLPAQNMDPHRLEDLAFRDVLDFNLSSNFPAKSCREWKRLTYKEKDAYSIIDKFADIEVTKVRNTCWLFENFAKAQPAKILIGGEDALASPHNFPATLILKYDNDQHVVGGELAPKADGTMSFEDAYTLNGKDITLSLFNARPKTIAQLWTEYMLFPRENKRVNMYDGLEFYVRLNESKKIEALFLRARTQIQIVFKGLDMDGDGREELGVIVEYDDITGNYSMCYAAILTRRYTDPTVGNIFQLNESVPAGRCS